MFAPTSRTLRGEILSRYLAESLRIRSPKTVAHYGVMLRQFAECLGHEPTLDDLEDFAVSSFMRWTTARGRSVETANQKRHYLAALWRWCARKGLVTIWPSVQNYPKPERIPRAWSADQIHRLLTACRAQRGIIVGIPAAQWWEGFYRVIWDSGERTGATLGLRWDMLDLGSGELEAPADIRKGRHKAMLYQLKPATLDLLRKMHAIHLPQWATIFPWIASLGTFYDRHKALLRSAGLPTGRRNGPQRMRRSFASHLERAGGNATDALGHSARSVTVASYLDPSIVQREPPNRKLFDL